MRIEDAARRTLRSVPWWGIRVFGVSEGLKNWKHKPLTQGNDEILTGRVCYMGRVV